MKSLPKIAVVVSHPIQHFCPQYVSFAHQKQVQSKVFFGSALGYKKYADVNFRNEIAWSNLRLDKFEHVFLNGDRVLPSDKNLDASTLEVELNEYKPDLVIIYGYFQKLQRRSYRWATKNKIPLAYISDTELRQKRSRAKQMIKYFFVRWYFSKIDYFLSVGDANEIFYKYYGVKQDKLIRMHFPIDIYQYEKSFHEKDELKNRIRTEYGISSSDVVLSVVGKLVPWKNQDHIIEALKILEDVHIYLHLFVLGSGEMGDFWKKKSSQLKKSKIYFPGFVNIEELPAYYAATDIYVHPASVEPHSIAVSEAIFMGCPIIISDRCGSYGNSDDVQEGKNGFVYPFGNIQQLAEKIKMLINNSDQRKSFSEYSHKIATEFQQLSHVKVLDALNKRMTSGKN